VAFLMGPVEREGNLDVAFPGERIIEPADLMELVSVLSGASLYIGNDSGVSHLAGIIGTPTITLYTTTDSAIWGVLGRSVVHIEAKDEDRALLSIRRHLKILLR
jgi:heptosyltransferase III